MPSPPGGTTIGPKWSRKMNGPTMRRFTLGSTRRTAKPGPSSCARPWIRSSIGSAILFSSLGCAATTRHEFAISHPSSRRAASPSSAPASAQPRPVAPSCRCCARRDMAEESCRSIPKAARSSVTSSVTSISAIDPPVELAVIVIRPDAILDAVKRGGRPRDQEPADPARRLRRSGPGRRGAQRGPAEARRRARPHHRRAQLRRHHPPRSEVALRRHLPARPAARRRTRNGLAFISQSGALAEEVIDKANARGLPLVSVVSVGNAVHLGVEDYLAWLGERPEIGAALLYVESIEDHERFRSVARKVAATKPVIALFGGRTGIGARPPPPIPAPWPTTMPRSMRSAPPAASCGSRACAACWSRPRRSAASRRVSASGR